MSEDYKQICLSFYNQAHKKINLQGGLNKLYYVAPLQNICSAFEGFFNYKEYKGKARNKREKFAQNCQDLFDNWNKTNLFNQSLKILEKESPVQNLDTKKYFTISQNSDLKEIMNFSFVPRGNLTHAEKDLLRDDKIGQRNRNLVEFSFKALHEILQMVLSREKWI